MVWKLVLCVSGAVRFPVWLSFMVTSSAQYAIPTTDLVVRERQRL
jgi:hypothetical protein